MNYILFLIMAFFMFITYRSISKQNNNQYKETEGFLEKDESKDSLEEIHKCKNFNCIYMKDMQCKKNCEESIPTKMQSKSAINSCKFNCTRLSNQVRDSVRYTDLIFGRN